MAYTETDGGAGIDKPLDNSFVTRSELYAILDQLKESNKFYELEVFEIVEISDSKNDLLKGEVVGRYVFSEQGDDIEELEGRTFLPLNSNIIQYPLRGELWLGMSYKGQQYYLARLSENIEDINFQAFNESSRTSGQTTDFERGGGFVNTFPTPARVNTGDTLFQGRFSNFINIGNIENTGSIEINNNSSVLSMTNVEEPRVQILSDKFLVGVNDTIDLIAGKDINLQSNQGDVLITSEDKITLNPRNSKIEFDIKESGDGQIVNLTKEGIPFPDLNMAGFLKQTMGIQKLFQAFTVGVPKLSNPVTLPSGVKDIVKGLEGAKNFVEATLNLEFLEQNVLTTKTIGEIKASLPIPASLLNVVGDIDEFSQDIEGAIQKAENFKNDNEAKLERANQISAGIDAGDRKDLLAILENIPAEERDQIPGANDALAIAQDKSVGGGDIPRARENGVFRLLEDYIAEQGSVEGDVEQLKMYGKILNLTNRSNNE